MSGLHFGVRFWTPKRGPFCRQNFKVTGRKIARGSIVSARTRQKFSMPLLFHGFAAPQALVLHARRTFMATPVLELFKNRCGHKRSQGVENNCSRRCKTMGTQWPSGMQNFCRVPAETIETCTIFARRQKFCRQTGTKSSGHKQIKLRLNEWPPFWGPFLDPKAGAVLSAKF